MSLWKLIKSTLAFYLFCKTKINTKNLIGKTKKKYLLPLTNFCLRLGPILNEDGDIIISEEEFLEIQRLKDLKTNYRTKYDELHNLKSEITYCQKLVDQCRLRLIQGQTEPEIKLKTINMAEWIRFIVKMNKNWFLHDLKK